MNTPDPTVCLAMIVREEAPVIRRCLASVLPFIDYWVVVDTGSTDGTQAIVRECLQAVPGELIERPWVSFGHNRTEALAYARGHGTYVLVIDADETLEVAGGFRKSGLAADAYLLETHYGSLAYVRKLLLRNDLPWRFEGDLHEHAVCQDAAGEAVADGLRIRVNHDGARARDPLTYRRDALLLETALLSEPENTRYIFYLAQSYRDAGDFELAVRHYRRRAEMGGWREEVWYSLYQIASLHERMEAPWGMVLQEYLDAFEFEPGRAEPLFRAGSHYLQTGEVHLARLFLARALQVPYPAGRSLFVEKDLYRCYLPLQYAAACGQAGEHGEAIATCNRLLHSRDLPPEAIERVLETRSLSLQPRLQPRPALEATAPIKVCIPFRNPGPEFDDCIESLLLQEGDPFEVVLIDDGSQDCCAGRLPLDRPGFHLLRNETPLGFAASLDHFITTQCGPDELILPLDGASRLASRRTIQHMRAVFKNEACRLLYGQHRLPDGRVGDAEPAADEADFQQRLAALAGPSPVVFLARLWQEHRPPTLPGTPWVDALFRAAGFEMARFSDEVFTISSPARSSEHAGLPQPLGRPEAQPAPPADPQAAPRVSCLMVTHDRLALAKRSIRCFVDQTYPNRELVIVSDGEPRIRRSLERFVAALGLENVRFVYPKQGELTLGQLRNIAIDAAAGPILCQWDDDDCYHPERIQVQVEHMLRNDGRACFLTDHLQFLEEDQALVWVDWTLGGRSGREQLLPGTLVMFKDNRFRYPEAGRFARRGEDSDLLNQLCDHVPVVPVKGLGYLYLYTYHGRNTFDREHHYRLSLFGRTVDGLEQEKDVIRQAMAHYPVPRPYLVAGSDGPAYMLDD